MSNRKPRNASCKTLFAICYSLFAMCFLAGCQAPNLLRFDATPTPIASPAPVPTPIEESENPPRPVVTISPLPNGEFLAGVGPVGDVETGFEWRLYRGRDDAWRRLSWPPEARPRSLHPSPSSGLIFAVPFNNALFGRGQAWGLMRSSNGGRSWDQSLEGLGDPYVMDLAFSPTFDEDRTLFAVTWYSGAYRSSDAGQSWESMPLAEATEPKPSGGPNPYDLALTVSPNYTESQEGLILASFSHKVHRWQSNSEAWQTIPLTVTLAVEDQSETQSLPEEAQLTAGAIAFSPTFSDDNTIYLYSGYAGLFRSTDRGETWQDAHHRLPLPPPFVADFHLAVASADEAYVLLTSAQFDSALRQPVQTLFRTGDGGHSWEELIDPPTLGWVSAFALGRDEEGHVLLHLGGSRGGISSHLANSLSWD